MQVCPDAWMPGYDSCAHLSLTYLVIVCGPSLRPNSSRLYSSTDHAQLNFVDALVYDIGYEQRGKVAGT